MAEDTNPSLREAVAKAAEDDTTKEKLPEGKTAETKGEGEGEHKETEGDNKAGDPEIDEALSFYRAIKDPAQQVNIIRDLALRAGLLNQNITPQEQKKEEKKFNDVLSEVLGTEYPDLTSKLVPIFAALQKENDDKIQRINAERAYEKQEQAKQDFQAEYDRFLKENKVTEDEAGKMLAEIRELPPTIGANGQRMNLTTYLSKIHRLVVGEKKQIQSEVKRVEKIQQNLKERSTNISSDISEGRLKKGSNLPSIREAVRAASEGISFDKD